MKTTLLILALLLPTVASAEELVYDQNWNLKYRIEDGRVYDKNWQLKGYIQDGKIYDRNERGLKGGWDRNAARATLGGEFPTRTLSVVRRERGDVGSNATF
jgi:hypothetical protein